MEISQNFVALSEYMNSSVKTSGRFFQIFVPFSEKLDFKKVNNKIWDLNLHAQTGPTYYIVEYRLDTSRPSGSRWGCRNKAYGNASGGKNNRHRRRNSPKRGVQWRQTARWCRRRAAGAGGDKRRTGVRRAAQTDGKWRVEWGLDFIKFYLVSVCLSTSTLYVT